MKKLVLILMLSFMSINFSFSVETKSNSNLKYYDYSPAICWDFATAIADLHGGSDDWFEYALNTCMELSEH